MSRALPVSAIEDRGEGSRWSLAVTSTLYGQICLTEATSEQCEVAEPQQWYVCGLAVLVKVCEREETLQVGTWGGAWAPRPRGLFRKPLPPSPPKD